MNLRKILCQNCFDNYSAGAICSGVCCGKPLVLVPLCGWLEIQDSDKEVISKFIAVYGEELKVKVKEFEEFEEELEEQADW